MIVLFYLTLLLFAMVATLRDDVLVMGQENSNNNNNILGAGSSIPGTTQTNSGYDTEVGMDAICWRSQGQVATNVTKHIVRGINMSNPLLQNFILQDRGVTLLRSCPTGNSLIANEPIEYIRGERLRTKQWYNYTVLINLDLSTLHSTVQNPYIISDQGPYIAVQVLVCQLGRSGFCSPFIHEAPNVRLQAMNSTLPKPGPGESHGGTHVHSKFQYIYLPPNISTGSNHHRYTNITVHVPMMINTPGQYFTIAAAQLYLGSTRRTTSSTDRYNDADASSSVLVRYDMANAIQDLDHRVFTYQSPVTILELPNVIRIVSYIVIGVSGTIIVGMLYYTIRHRNHQVMKLTQGYFLILFLIAALVATIMCMYLEPRNDLYCQISLPSILISAQFMYAITLGRLWRINTLISPLLMQSLRYKSSWIRRLSDSIRRSVLKSSLPSSSDTDPINLRRTVNSKQLCVVVWFITAPQVVIQAFALILQTPYQNFEYNIDESIGRAYCHRGDDLATSFAMYGFVCFGALVILLLLVAHHTKSLPSLFNETNDIFSSTLASLCIFVIGGGIVLSTNSPTTSPAMQYLIGLSLAISITLNNSIRIVMPKLRMIWCGETVLVSKLVSDHSKTVRRRNFLDNSHADKTEAQNDMLHNTVKQSESSESNIPYFVNDNQKYENQEADEPLNVTLDTGKSAHTQLVESSSPLEKNEEPSRDIQTVDNNSANRLRKFWNMPSRRNLMTASYTVSEHPTNIVGTPNGSMQCNITNVSLLQQPVKRSDPNNGSSNGSAIYISNITAPSRRLLIPLVEMQCTLQEMNQRIMSGLCVSESEWVTLRQQSLDLGHLFNDQVHFQWEQQLSTFESKPKQFGVSVDIESNNRTKQASLDTFDESNNEEEEGGESGNDDDAPDQFTIRQVRLRRYRLEL